MTFAGHLSPILFSILIHMGFALFAAGMWLSPALVGGFWIPIIAYSAISSAAWYLSSNGLLLYWCFFFTAFFSYWHGLKLKVRVMEFLSYMEGRGGADTVSS